MTGLSITLTNAGLAALTAASGSNAITIASVGLTAASFTPTADATSLTDQIKTLTTVSGDVPDDYTVHLSIRDESADTYKLRGFGLYLSDGTLFGIYGNGDALIMEKASGSILLLSVDLNFSESTATAITFGDTNFINPPATTETKGVAELATDAEATTGTDTVRVVTPAGMLAAVTSWLNDRFGSGAPSAFVKGLLTCTSAVVLRTALELKSAALQETTAFATASHTHTIAQVSGLQTTLDAKLASASYTAADVLAKLKTVDGAGSGVDADTVDGKQASAFALTGGSNATGEWPINVNGFSTSVQIAVTGTNVTNLLYAQMADNDYFRIRVGGTASNAGYAEIATADDGNEPIYVRQYNGVFDTVKRTLTLLDGSGNTSLPGSLSIGGYGAWHSGNLQKSEFATASHTHAWSAITSKPSTFTPSSHTHPWSQITGTPSTYAPSSHTHTIAQITNLQSTLDAKMASGVAHVTSSGSSKSGGYRVWSDGFKECWLTSTTPANGTSTHTFPISFSSWSLAVVNGGNNSTSAEDNGPFVYSTSLTNAVVYNGLNGTVSIQLRAWGY